MASQPGNSLQEKPNSKADEDQLTCAVAVSPINSHALQDRAASRAACGAQGSLPCSEAVVPRYGIRSWQVVVHTARIAAAVLPKLPA